ncbi:MAG: lipopolysaccharide heptosyltransferase II [Desulfobacterales bacterium]|nr:lipopolysaccharide heptosyltransferase II [Desulfobacterales bacterium]MDJ0854603.1 lipopolysaccharide heptosyltransferase II [Desulfobacterales bacterium]MDJ0886976.1 lipopolysaccharide heptosyltransferase II [Desulfobacterales bacterium]MDJ0991281.1 lipopolysaccharide heptosyltransferase II [Desulfobacterales bacterium]
MPSPLVNRSIQRRASNASVRRTLLVQTSYLGDTVLSTPLIAALHQLHPRTQLWLMTTPAAAGLVTDDPLVHRVIAFDKRGRDRGFTGILRMSRRLRRIRFDRAYALQRSYRTGLILFLSGIPHRTGFQSARLASLFHSRQARDAAQHDVFRNLSLLAGEAPLSAFDASLRLFPPAVERLEPEIAVQIINPKPYVLLVPGSAWPTKRWRWEHFRTVADRLLGRGYRVILIGAAADRAVSRRVARGLGVVDLTGKTSIPASMTLVRHAAGVVCNDSLAQHLASTFRKPCVVVFCATSPAFGFGPWQNPNAVVVEAKNLACKPCARHGGPRCPNGTQACMQTPQPQAVIDALESVLPAP